MPTTNSPGCSTINPNRLARINLRNLSGTTATKPKDTYSVPPDDSPNERSRQIIAAAGICNDDPGWDEFMQSVATTRQERDAEYLATLVE